MRKYLVIAVVVLCLASMGFAQLDYSLDAVMDNSHLTSLVNNGSEDIYVFAVVFHDDGGMLIPSGVMDMWLDSGIEPLFDNDQYTITIGDLSGSISGTGVTIPSGSRIDVGVISGGNEMHWQAHFNTVAGQVVPYFELVPEPASASLLTLGALALIRRGRNNS